MWLVDFCFISFDGPFMSSDAMDQLSIGFTTDFNNATFKLPECTSAKQRRKIIQKKSLKSFLKFLTGQLTINTSKKKLLQFIVVKELYKSLRIDKKNLYL